MPKKPGYITSRLNNFKSSAKRLLEHLSPRKKNKKQRTEEPDVSTDLDDVSVTLSESLKADGVKIF